MADIMKTLTIDGVTFMLTPLWDNIENKPTTLEGYGINEVPVNLLTGTISVDNLPHGALNKCVIVEDDKERFELTSDDVKNGDTVKVNDTGLMYFVVDDTKLNLEEGYTVYSASVDWAGITGTPNTLEGYGITDAVKSDDVVSAPMADKILKLNGDGNLPASITGDANTVGGKQASDFVAANDVTTTATANKLLKLNNESKLPASITGSADSASKVEWTGVQNVPINLNNLFANNMTKLTLNNQYGDTLPDAGNIGRIFFKKVSN